MLTYVLQEGKERNYIAFCMPKTHFSLHMTDLEYVWKIHHRFPHLGNRKGCINVKYKNRELWNPLFAVIDEVVEW